MLQVRFCRVHVREQSGFPLLSLCSGVHDPYYVENGKHRNIFLCICHIFFNFKQYRCCYQNESKLYLPLSLACGQGNPAQVPQEPCNTKIWYLGVCEGQDQRAREVQKLDPNCYLTCVVPCFLYFVEFNYRSFKFKIHDSKFKNKTHIKLIKPYCMIFLSYFPWVAVSCTLRLNHDFQIVLLFVANTYTVTFVTF